MNLTLLDEYVRLTLEHNGWTQDRDFPLADSWISEIEQGGFSCFSYAEEILHSLGGLKIREASPKASQHFLKQCHGDISQLEEWYVRTLKVLDRLSQKFPLERYTGATFTFDARFAFLDQEIVMDVNKAEAVIGEKLFPIGTVEPDGISYAAENGGIYTLFDDSIFLSGTSIEHYLNTLFIRQYKPLQIL